MAAFSGIGKSTMLMQMAFNAFSSGYTPLIISLEMSAKQILRKFDAMWGHLAYHELKRLTLEDGDVAGWRERAKELRERTNDIPILDSIRGCTPEHVFGETVKHKPDLVIIDYITLMKSSHGRGAAKWHEITEVTQDLKQNALMLGVPVLAAAQLNRAGKDDASTENTGYSISIVQDSDIYLGLTRVRDPQDKDQYLEGQIEAHLNKNRDGKLGKFYCIWDHENLDFREMKPSDPPKFGGMQRTKPKSDEQAAEEAAVKLAEREKTIEHTDIDEELNKMKPKRHNPFKKAAA